MRYNIPEQEGNNHVGTDYIAFSSGLVRADGGVGYCLGLRVPGLWAGGGIFSLLLGVAVLVLLVALISRAFGIPAAAMAIPIGTTPGTTTLSAFMTRTR